MVKIHLELTSMWQMQLIC